MWSLTTFIGKEKKYKTKGNPSCFIPCLLVVFIRQLEIVVTTLATLLNNSNNDLLQISLTLIYY